MFLPCTILEKFRLPEPDPLLPHYAIYLPSFECIVLGDEEAHFMDILMLEEAEHPILLVSVMRNNLPEIISLWGPAKHLDPPYSHTSEHGHPCYFAGTWCKAICLLPHFSIAIGW
jgi:hypothetical protein